MKGSFLSDDTGSFLNVRAKVLKKMRASGVSDRIATLLEETFESLLSSENLVINKLERKILMADISAQILNELAVKIMNNK